MDSGSKNDAETAATSADAALNSDWADVCLMLAQAYRTSFEQFFFDKNMIQVMEYSNRLHNMRVNEQLAIEDAQNRG